MNPKKQNILSEAEGLIYGDREQSYGPPTQDFQRAVGMFNAMFADILKAPLSPADWAYIMIICKLSRQAHRPKRDNLVDIAGYAACAERVLEDLGLAQDDGR